METLFRRQFRIRIQSSSPQTCTQKTQYPEPQKLDPEPSIQGRLAQYLTVTLHRCIILLYQSSDHIVVPHCCPASLSHIVTLYHRPHDHTASSHRIVLCCFGLNIFIPLFKARDACLNVLDGFENYVFFISALCCLELLPRLLSISGYFCKCGSLHHDFHCICFARCVM